MKELDAATQIKGWNHFVIDPHRSILPSKSELYSLTRTFLLDENNLIEIP